MFLSYLRVILNQIPMNEAQIGKRVDRPTGHLILNNHYNDGKDELGGFYEFTQNSTVRYVGEVKDGGGILHGLFLEEIPNGDKKSFKLYSPRNSFDGELVEPTLIGDIEARPSSEYGGSRTRGADEISISIRNNGNEQTYILKALEGGKLVLSRARLPANL